MPAQNKAKQGFTTDPFWNYHPEVPLKFAPYYDRPKSIRAIAKYWLNTWNPLGVQFIFLCIAILAWVYFTPTLESAIEFEFSWIFEIWLRNMLLILAVAGGLHLYLHTFEKQGSEFKYDKRQLGKKSRRFHFNNQNWDNMFWTLTSGVLLWTLWESLLLWAFANSYASLITLQSNPIWFVVLLAFIPLWSSVYFDLQHRVMHTKWLYKHVHNWHHKNGNTGPWSGLAMHPFEQLVLMSDTLIFFVIAAHPIHLIYSLMFHGLGAPTSHTGFEKLKIGKRVNISIGDFYHQLHHRFFDTNFGTLDSPWDKWSGNFHDGSMQGHAQFLLRRKASRQ
ncbi:MAG: lathosterol oxidase [Cryomorphaceae bacterium]|jgi:lathosterol oxidase